MLAPGFQGPGCNGTKFAVGCRWMQRDAVGCRGMQLDAERRSWMQMDADGFRVTQLDADGCRATQLDAVGLSWMQRDEVAGGTSTNSNHTSPRHFIPIHASVTFRPGILGGLV